MKLLFYLDRCDENIQNMINECAKVDKVKKIFIVSFNNILFSDEKIETICVEKSSIKEITYLGNEFAKSYIIAEKIYKICKNEFVDIISFSSKLIDVYYTIQFKYFYDDVLENTNIVLNNCVNSVCKYIYRFPDYWIKKKEIEILKLSDFISDNDFINPLEINLKNAFEQTRNLEINFYNTRLEKDDEDTYKYMLSIIVPYYNLGDYIEETIDNLIKIEMDNYEIIIVNDGSTESKSNEKLKIMRDKCKNLKIINKKNQGLAEARNTGALSALGKYITFLDADDKVDDNYYKLAIHLLEKYDFISFVYSWVEIFDGKKEIWPTFNIDMPYLLLSNMLSAFPIIRKVDFLKYGMNRKEMDKGMEDYDSWINMVDNGCFGVSIPKALSKYRYRLGSMSKSFDRNVVLSLYEKIFNKHRTLYQRYGDEIIKILYYNGPGYLWNNPTLNYPPIALLSNDEFDNEKYELIRLANSRIGKFLLNIFFKLRLNKLFK